MLVLLGALPHLLPATSHSSGGALGWLAQRLDPDVVAYWFDVVNSGSFLYLIVPVFFLELVRYVFRRRMSLNLLGDSFVNGLTFMAFTAIEGVIGVLFVTQLYYWVHLNFSLPHLPLTPWTLLFVVLLADFAYYWDHRFMHRVGLGWATHTVHHSSPHFNMSVAYRFGPLDAIFPILFSLPIVALGFDPLLVLTAEVFVQVFQTLLHTEAVGKFPRFIEAIFNTPSHHRVHHGANRQYWDKNYAGILIIWDRLFGTFEPEEEEVVFGVSEPIESINPLVVFFHGFTRLWRKMGRAHSWGAALWCLVAPPEYDPAAPEWQAEPAE